MLFNVCCLGHSCRSTAARYIKSSDTTIILQPKVSHYCDFLNFMFEMPLGILKLHPKGRHYRIFLSFRFHWALLACLRWSLGTLGLPWVPLEPLGLHSSSLGVHGGASGASWGSICRLWGSILAPSTVIGGHSGGTLRSFASKNTKNAPELTKNKSPNCELDPIFVRRKKSQGK